MIYLIIGAIALAAAAGGGFYGGYSWEAGRWAEETAKRQAAEAQVVEKSHALEQEVANHEQDIATAFEAGQAKAKTVYVKVQQRGASDVANNAVFSNRTCDWPTASVQLVNRAFASLRTPTDPGIADAAVPTPAPIAGGPTGSSLPVAPVAPRTVEPVRSDARATGGGGEVPGTGSTRPPKPTPRGTK